MEIKYIDLFAGIGGFRYGIEAFEKINPKYKFRCIKTVDIKKDAINTYNINFNENNKPFNICDLKNVEQFDLLCAGFPCQPFSSAGKKEGLNDKSRGSLIYEVLRICEESRPKYLILENVSNIEKINKGDTIKQIVDLFEKQNYNMSYVSINAMNIGLAQDRERIFIIGSKISKVIIPVPNIVPKFIKDIIDINDSDTKIPREFIEKILNLSSNFIGKSIKDKRGGKDNIHSWDIEYYGKINENQKNIMNQLLKERRKKKWAEIKKITWMDGMPLTFDEIKTFINYSDLKEDLDDLVSKNYLNMIHPKDLINGKREYRLDIPIGYNINKGKLSFPISKILNPDDIAPTLTATDSSKLALYVNNTIRQLNHLELKRLCGFPEKMILPQNVNIYDLFGNMVCPPIITYIMTYLIQ